MAEHILPPPLRRPLRNLRGMERESGELHSTSTKRTISFKKSTSPNNSVTCSLKSCTKSISLDDSARVEVKTTLPKISEYLVNWNHIGEAVFHAACWHDVEKTARARMRRVNSADGKMSKEEKVAVHEAAETAEWHDSDLTICHEAVRIASLLRNSSYAIAFTGAGISTSAGIGDYRGKDGMWTKMDRTASKPKEKTEHTQEKVKKMPPKVEEEDEDGVCYEDLRPTYTHEALVKLMEMGYLKHVISQNGDGLHGLSGIPLDSLSELHGNVFLEICEKCRHHYYRPHYVLDDTVSDYYEEIEEFGSTTIIKPKHARQCKECGLSHRTGRRCEQKDCKGFLKDSIINFRDDLDEAILTTAKTHAQKADLCLSLGTTMQVTPACHLVTMGQKPLRLVIVNRQKTDLDKLACACLPSPNDGCQLGSRVYGDTDCLMQEVMKEVMTEADLQIWESERSKRMQQYDHTRTSNLE